MAEVVLITDSLFISGDHEEMIRSAGFLVERLDAPCAPEDELCERIRGKHGYILGGIEKVTDRVIESADVLRAIAFTGSGYSEHIPAHALAQSRGIVITSTPGAVAPAVAEYTIALMLGMIRNIVDAGRTGNGNAVTTLSLLDLRVGIVGLGHIGQAVVRALVGLGVRDVCYYSPHRKHDIESSLGVRFMERDDLLSQCDVVSLHASKEAGEPYITAGQLNMLRDGALLINASYAGAVDSDALLNELRSGRIRAAFDAPPMGDFGDLPFGSWYCSRSQMGFNTVASLRLVSDMATRSLINVLTTGHDDYIVPSGTAAG